MAAKGFIVLKRLAVLSFGVGLSLTGSAGATDITPVLTTDDFSM